MMSVTNSLSTSNQNVRGAINELATRLNNKSVANIDYEQYTANVISRIAKVEKIGNNLVHIMLQLRFNVNVPTTTNFALIPSGYRPKKAINVPAHMKIDGNNEIFFYPATIYANGTIKQELSNSMRKISIDSIYEI